MGKRISNLLKKWDLFKKNRKFLLWKVSTQLYGEKMQMNMATLKGGEFSLMSTMQAGEDLS
jgi:hypothetical protein